MVANMSIKKIFDSEEEYNEFMSKIESEGFDYAMTDYSDWDEIQDEKFHKLRNAFVKARQALLDYIDLDGWYDSEDEDEDDDDYDDDDEEEDEDEDEEDDD